VNSEANPQFDGPKRRFTIRIDAGGDTMEDAVRLARELARKIGDGGPVITGGYSSGGVAEVIERPEMDHERYCEQLEAHLATNP
jgi:hypothetical protein